MRLILGVSAAATLLGAGYFAEIRPLVGARWTDPQGHVASERRYEGSSVPYEHHGPGHCGWDDLTFISYLGGVYSRNTRSVIAESGESYDNEASLPPDAHGTGWRKGDMEIYVSDSRRALDTTPLDLYVVGPNRVERLPHFWFVCE